MFGTSLGDTVLYFCYLYYSSSYLGRTKELGCCGVFFPRPELMRMESVFIFPQSLLRTYSLSIFFQCFKENPVCRSYPLVHTYRILLFRESENMCFYSVAIAPLCLQMKFRCFSLKKPFLLSENRTKCHVFHINPRIKESKNNNQCNFFLLPV